MYVHLVPVPAQVEAIRLLEQLEAWVERQAMGVALAHNAEKLASSFESLLKVSHVPVHIVCCCVTFRLACAGVCCRMIWLEPAMLFICGRIECYYVLAASYACYLEVVGPCGLVLPTA